MARFDEVLAAIRGLDGFAAFALPPAPEELLAAAEHGPIATINVSRYRSDALLLTADGVDVVELPGLHDALPDQLGAFDSALESPSGDIGTVLAWLWDAVAEPVISRLERTGQLPDGPASRIWWAPGGFLGLLPLHAVGRHGEPGASVVDRVVSSYTVTVRALRYARRPPVAPPGPLRSVVVAMPTTPGSPVGRWRAPEPKPTPSLRCCPDRHC